MSPDVVENGKLIKRIKLLESEKGKLIKRIELLESEMKKSQNNNNEEIIARLEEKNGRTKEKKEVL